mmetsp:Transcript_19197/g.57657  ORF Transcript_19197/g.57657 Transcript_19197/m.57657 type:complete len:236 (-) Transcript_19197:297-1004(-)
MGAVGAAGAAARRIPQERRPRPLPGARRKWRGAVSRPAQLLPVEFRIRGAARKVSGSRPQRAVAGGRRALPGEGLRRPEGCGRPPPGEGRAPGDQPPAGEAGLLGGGQQPIERGAARTEVAAGRHWRRDRGQLPSLLVRPEHPAGRRQCRPRAQGAAGRAQVPHGAPLGPQPAGRGEGHPVPHRRHGAEQALPVLRALRGGALGPDEAELRQPARLPWIPLEDGPAQVLPRAYQR